MRFIHAPLVIASTSNDAGKFGRGKKKKKGRNKKGKEKKKQAAQAEDDVIGCVFIGQ